MKKKLIAIFVLFFVAHAFADASIIDSDENTVNVYFTGTAGGPENWYQDALTSKGNPDATIRVCDIGSSQYIGATYCIDNSGSTEYALISYKSSTEPLAQATTSSGACYKVSPEGNLWFSPSSLSLTPPVYYAAFPGIPCILHSNDPSGSNPQFITPDDVTGSLRGSYSVGRSYTESSDTLSVSTPSISFEYQGGSTSQSAASGTFGINSNRRMALGVCTDQYGTNCNHGMIKTDTSFPETLNVGVTPSDSVTYDRYLVINGLGYPVCIGANLRMNSNDVSVNQSEVYYNQTLGFSYTIRNYRDTPDENQGGNVEVSTNFNVLIEILNSSMDTVDSWTVTIGDDIAPGTAVTAYDSWKASVHSGTYYVQVTADSGDAIAECVESDNDDRQSFEVKAVTIPEVYINGQRNDSFPYPARPYNFTIHVRNSDEENTYNASMKVVEENGISLLGPTQVWNRTINDNGTTQKTGIFAKTEANFETDYNGNASFTIIPTSNKLYSSEYNYTNISSYVGDYSLYIEGVDRNNETLMFLIDEDVRSTYNLTVLNPYNYEEGSDASFFNQEVYTEQVLDWAYSIFSNFWNMVTS